MGHIALITEETLKVFRDGALKVMLTVVDKVVT
jgi:hypothetical protein